MKTIKNWKSFNENSDEKNQILTEIVKKIGVDNLSDITFGKSLTPYVYFIYNNIPFSISLTDRLGMSGEYRTISVIVEKDGTTDTIGSYDINELDEVVDLILNY